MNWEASRATWEWGTKLVEVVLSFWGDLGMAWAAHVPIIAGTNHGSSELQNEMTMLNLMLIWDHVQRRTFGLFNWNFSHKPLPASLSIEEIDVHGKLRGREMEEKHHCQAVNRGGGYLCAITQAKLLCSMQANLAGSLLQNWMGMAGGGSGGQCYRRMPGTTGAVAEQIHTLTMVMAGHAWHIR